MKKNSRKTTQLRNRQTTPPADRPRTEPENDSTLVWHVICQDRDTCQCRIINAGPIAGVIVSIVAPGPPAGAPPPPANTLLGIDSAARWDPTVSVQNPTPCSLQVDFPAVPPPARPFSLLAFAGIGRFRGFAARVPTADLTLTARGTYHVHPKDAPGVLRATLAGTLTGVQFIAGRIGSGRSIVTADLIVNPFPPQLVRNPAAGALGRIDFSSIFLPGTAGAVAPFVVPFAAVATVTCCRTYHWQLIMFVYARRSGVVSTVSSIDRFTFTITAPDPPTDVSIKIDSLEVNDKTLPATPEPLPATGYSLRRLQLPSSGGTATAMAVHEERLLLTNQRGFEERTAVTDLLEINPDTGRSRLTKSKSLGMISKLKSLTTDAHKSILYALDLGRPDPNTGLPVASNARLVGLDARKQQRILAKDLDMPSDLVVLLDGNTRLLLVSEVSSGRIYKVGKASRLDVLVEGFRFPVALAVPPTGSPWTGSFYVAEADQMEEKSAPSLGRIREVRLRQCQTYSFLNRISVNAMAFSPGGQFQQDLLVVTSNELQLLTQTPIGNTGQILRVSPDGVVTPVVTAIDDPFDISFTKEGRCFVLAGSGLFEVTVK